jgi:hypothetical protein
MSLDYDLSQINNRDKSDHGWEVTQSIIFGCMITDLGTITLDNHEEWFARLKVINPSTMITLQDVHDHIGLRTNVINRSRDQWCKGILHNHMTIIVRDAKHANKITNEREADRPHDFEREDDDHRMYGTVEAAAWEAETGRPLGRGRLLPPCAICGEPRHAPQHQ